MPGSTSSHPEGIFTAACAKWNGLPIRSAHRWGQFGSGFHLSLLHRPQCFARPSRGKLKQVGRKVKGAANLELKQISITLPLKTHALTSVQSLVAPGTVPSPQSLGTPVTLSRHGRQQAHKPEPGREGSSDRSPCNTGVKFRRTLAPAGSSSLGPPMSPVSVCLLWLAPGQCLYWSYTMCLTLRGMGLGGMTW